MKKVLILLLTTILFYSCKQENTEIKPNVEEDVKVDLHLNGVWQLVSFYNYKDNKITDTIVANPENPQIKIFLDSKVMWSRKEPKGDEEYFAYGSYSITDSTLVETLEFGSREMLRVIDTSQVFKFELIKGEDTFTQIDIGPEGDRTFSENYIRIIE